MKNPLKLILPDDFDEQAIFELPYKGCVSAEVERDDGSRFHLNFFDPVRLQQTIEDAFQQNLPCLAEPGLLVLPEVTIERMQQALDYLEETGFFISQEPDSTPLNRGN